ncbi:hypothetical protein Pmani_030459 [Petrolisthes manimaculis]|uniref:Ubiquitin-like domain-containing protein n=1 Tax=Petrolisthes manimaculis TaxID=1843537 RepID=A0AAE1NWM3_9EUCA|nr:hypothetical protein Pmani_030459 [Petrolisthes manimaculis]
MKVTVKILQGSECTLNVPETTKVFEVKSSAEKMLSVSPSSQRLVYKGKTLSDDMTLKEAGVSDGGKIHLMVKKGEAVHGTGGAGSSKSTPQQQFDFFLQLDTFLSKHLTQEQTSLVVGEFKKNCQLMVDSMNFDDIERFAASNCTEF